MAADDKSTERLIIALVQAAGGRVSISTRMLYDADSLRLELYDGVDCVTYEVTDPTAKAETGGFYWVRHLRGGDWEPAEQSPDGGWFIPGLKDPQTVHEIGACIMRPADMIKTAAEVQAEAVTPDATHAMRPLQPGVYCKCWRLQTDKLNPEQHYCCQPAPSLPSTALGAA